MRGRPALVLAGLMAAQVAQAHTGGNPGVLSAWLHPLSGADHLVAMVAVGAWSALLGGRAVWTVPGAFLLMMLVGGTVGLQLIDVPGAEAGVALSVLLLGLAIALTERVPWPVAALAVGLFGFCHGYLHGYELSVVESPVLATLGFMVTTALLHVVGLVGAHVAMRHAMGRRLLRACGWAAAIFGVWLLAAPAIG